ncbi:NRAMP family divalent metal transporter [Glycomyces arizonensis]|uniref:NRAMP family divalent metal transporter n=1 Tax=Glycomyces arizonensis TaxID=256035 RepID=UPI0004182FB3|nr:divalent metal cation transporter [Glycomyces arizonensis]
MKKYLALTLGVLTAIGGFVDIGDIVTNAEAGARFGLGLTWVVVLGVIGICAYAEMSGRIVAATGRPVYDVIRERLGPRAALFNLIASFIVTLLTLAAQIGGVAVAIQLASGIPHVVWVAPVAIGLWILMWRVKFEKIERILGLAGLTIAVFAVSIWWLDPDWSALSGQVMSITPPPGEPVPTYLYYAVTLFAAAMTPYEVFFFSSGGVEERWTVKQLGIQRANVLIGFPLGGLLSLGIAAAAAVAILPLGMEVETLGQVVLPIGLAFGLAGMIVVLFGFFTVMVGAAFETAMSCGYMLAQYFGWQWGKRKQPKRAARFHAVVAGSVLLAFLIVQTGVDPVMITEVSLIGSAVALPLTYLPVLIVANDRQYLGDHVNGRFGNAVGLVTLLVVLIAAVAAIPLMIATGMGA